MIFRFLSRCVAVLFCAVPLVVWAQTRSQSVDFIGYNVYWNGSNWVSYASGYGNVIGTNTSTGDFNFYTTGTAASAGLTRTLTQAAAITAAGTVSSTAVQAYTGNFGNITATGTISTAALTVNGVAITSSGGGGGTSATMVAGWPDAIVCTASGGTMVVAFLTGGGGAGWSGNPIMAYRIASPDSYLDIEFNYTTGAFSGEHTVVTTDCHKSIAQLYASGQAFNFVGNGGANGVNGYDNIVSSSTKVTANGTGTISVTNAGVVTGYFDTAGRLVVPGVSTTTMYGIRSTVGYFSGEIKGGLASGYGQFRMVNVGNLTYGSMWRNDGATTYLLLTVSGDPYGAWNGLRPFYVDNATGVVTMGQGLVLTGGSLSVSGSSYLGGAGSGVGYVVAAQGGGTTTGYTDYITSGGTSYGYVGYGSGNIFPIWARSGMSLSLASSNTERVRIDTSGNVGIGTSSPGATLEVSGSATAAIFKGGTGAWQGIALQNNYASGSNYGAVFLDARNEAGAAVANMAGDINTDGSSAWSWTTQVAGSRTDRRTERMRIANNGNVGIGTSSPNAKLEVNGTISATALMVNGSAVTGGAGTAAGTVFWFISSTCPAGSLAANGAAISRSTYASLFAVAGTTFGTGDGTTTFNLPDLRGEFLRGYDNGRGVDSGRAFGSWQANAFSSHTHTGTTNAAGSHTHTAGSSASSGSSGGLYVVQSGSSMLGDVTLGASGNHTHTFTTNATGSTETRPRNVALQPCVKY